MQTQELVREFKYNSVALADPNPAFSLEQVRDFFAAVYPEILNAEIEGPTTKGNRQLYTFRRAVGTKGGTALPQMLADLTALLQAGWFDERSADFLKSLQERASGAVFEPSADERSRLQRMHAEHCRPPAEQAA